MAKAYCDSKYGVENVMFFPPLTISADVDHDLIVMPINITITEFGYVVTTLTSGSAPITTLGCAIREGSTTLGSIAIGAVGDAVGVLRRDTSITSATSVAKNDTLVFTTIATQTGQAGAVAPYIKYRERY